MKKVTEKFEDRKPGERARILFDDLDLRILDFLNQPTQNYEVKKFGVLDLVEGLHVKHISLKPHLDKLYALKLIGLDLDKKKNGKEKVYFTTMLQTYYNIYHGDDDAVSNDPEERKKIMTEIKRQEALIKYMRTALEFCFEDEKKKNMEIDFRKIRSELSREKEEMNKK